MSINFTPFIIGWVIGSILIVLLRYYIGAEKFNIIYIIKWIDSKMVKRSWRYNMTETQKWWSGVVEEDLAENGLEIDDDGHVRRVGDGKK